MFQQSFIRSSLVLCERPDVPLLCLALCKERRNGPAAALLISLGVGFPTGWNQAWDGVQQMLCNNTPTR